MSENSGDNRRRNRQARPVSELAAGILDPVIARRAGMKLDLLAGWAEIAGPLHAAYTRPDRIVWPKRYSDDDPFEPGVLVVACDGARAVLFQHELAEVMARTNVFFGFNAIARIRIVQKPVIHIGSRREPPIAVLNREEEARLDTVLAKIGDDRLRRSLKALGKGVIGRSKRRG